MPRHVWETRNNNLDELIQRTIEVWSGLQQNIVEEDIGKWRKWLWACVSNIYCITIENGLQKLKTFTYQQTKCVYWCVTDKMSCRMTWKCIKFNFISPMQCTNKRWVVSLKHRLEPTSFRNILCPKLSRLNTVLPSNRYSLLLACLLAVEGF